LIWKYTWDDANHLLTATEYNASTGAVQEQETNFWDVFGNLIEQDQYNASTGTTTVLKLANQIVGLSPGQQGTGGTAPVWADLNGGNQIESRRLQSLVERKVCSRRSTSARGSWMRIMAASCCGRGSPSPYDSPAAGNAALHPDH
jgi:hypothetical protein